jgi:hypothetical protein
MLVRIRPDIIANMTKVARDDQAFALVNTASAGCRQMSS